MAFQSDDEWGDEGGSTQTVGDSWGDIDIASEYLIEKTEKIEVSTVKGRRAKNAQYAENPLDSFGFVRKHFIMDHLRTIVHTDIARLLGIDADELKTAVERLGVTIPLERARPWAGLNVGTYVSPEACSRCQVQIRHARFIVGFQDCHACLEENIALWLEKNETIRIVLPGE